MASSSRRLEDIALLVAFDAFGAALGAGHAVGAVIVGKDYIAVLVKEIRKIVVTARVLRHTVGDLDDALGLFDIIPNVALDHGAVETLKLLVFHNHLRVDRPMTL